MAGKKEKRRMQQTRKQGTQPVDKFVDKKEPEKKKVNTANIALWISAMSLLTSIFAMVSANSYSKKEYAYKVDPQVTVAARAGAIKTSPEPNVFQTGISELAVTITERNNLDRAYVIYPDEQVEKLSLSDNEDTLNIPFKGGITAAPNITVDGVYEYKYFFVYLESLDDTGDLYLIYTKCYPGPNETKALEFQAYSGVEVYGLGKGPYENEAAYEGERKMAEDYVRILSELPRYFFR